MFEHQKHTVAAIARALAILAAPLDITIRDTFIVVENSLEICPKGTFSFERSATESFTSVRLGTDTLEFYGAPDDQKIMEALARVYAAPTSSFLKTVKLLRSYKLMILLINTPNNTNQPPEMNAPHENIM
jgi:hypothetical protein